MKSISMGPNQRVLEFQNKHNFEGNLSEKALIRYSLFKYSSLCKYIKSKMIYSRSLLYSFILCPKKVGVPIQILATFFLGITNHLDFLSRGFLKPATTTMTVALVVVDGTKW